MSAKVTVSQVETVKRFMMVFSRYLRRDFLAILVRMTSIILKLHTSRDDWRTRDGSLKFFARNWDAFSKILVTSKGLQWFVKHFDQFQKILCNRRLSLFIFKNWAIYGSLFSDPEFEKFLANNSVDFLNVLQGNCMEHPILKNEKFGKRIETFVRDFNGAHISTRSSSIDDFESEIASPAVIESPVVEKTTPVVLEEKAKEEKNPIVTQEQIETEIYDPSPCELDIAEPPQWADDQWEFLDSSAFI